MRTSKNRRVLLEPEMDRGLIKAPIFPSAGGKPLRCGRQPHFPAPRERPSTRRQLETQPGDLAVQGRLVDSQLTCGGGAVPRVAFQYVADETCLEFLEGGRFLRLFENLTSFCNQSGRSSTPISRPVESTWACSRMFSSSRTLPGKSCRISRRTASREIASTILPRVIDSRRSMVSARSGMSDGRSRRGGITIRMTLTR